MTRANIVVMKIFLHPLVFFLLLSPLIVFGQEGGLVPCGTGDNMCDTDDFMKLIDNLVNFLFTFLSIIAVIVLVVVGFRMVTSRGNEEEWKKAKSMFANVVIGIILVLAAWVIVDTLLKTLTGKDLNFWSVLQ